MIVTSDSHNTWRKLQDCHDNRFPHYLKMEAENPQLMTEEPQIHKKSVSWAENATIQFIEPRTKNNSKLNQWVRKLMGGLK